MQLLCSSGTSLKLHSGLKYSKTRGVGVISERGRGGDEGFLYLSQGAQARNQYLKLFRGKDAGIIWDLGVWSCSIEVQTGTMRHFQPCSHGTTREELRSVVSPWRACFDPPLPAGSLLPGFHLSWECLSQACQSTPSHSSSPALALLGPQPLTLVIPPAPRSRTGALEFGLSLSLAANIPAPWRDEGTPGFTPAAPGGIGWGWEADEAAPFPFS